MEGVVEIVGVEVGGGNGVFLADTLFLGGHEVSVRSSCTPQRYPKKKGGRFGTVVVWVFFSLFWFMWEVGEPGSRI